MKNLLGGHSLGDADAIWKRRLDENDKSSPAKRLKLAIDGGAGSEMELGPEEVDNPQEQGEVCPVAESLKSKREAKKDLASLEAAVKDGIAKAREALEFSSHDSPDVYDNALEVLKSRLELLEKIQTCVDMEDLCKPTKVPNYSHSLDCAEF